MADDDRDYDEYDDREARELMDCDCLEAEVDILEGIERCHVCGRTRYLSSEEFKLRLEQEAAWAAEYDAFLEKSN